MPSTSPAHDLNRFIARYTPDIARLARGALARMRRRLPTAQQLVYDNYNACAIGFSPTERASDVIFSIALYPQRVSLFFLQAMKSHLHDPQRLLQGSGVLVRFARRLFLALCNRSEYECEIDLARNGTQRLAQHIRKPRCLPENPCELLEYRTIT